MGRLDARRQRVPYVSEKWRIAALRERKSARRSPKLSSTPMTRSDNSTDTRWSGWDLKHSVVVQIAASSETGLRQ